MVSWGLSKLKLSCFPSSEISFTFKSWFDGFRIESQHVLNKNFILEKKGLEEKNKKPI